MDFQNLLKPIFAFIWRSWLRNQKLIKVTGWRSCIMENRCGQRMRVTFMIGYTFFHKCFCLSGNTEAGTREDIMLNTFTHRPRNINDTSTNGMI